MEIIEKAGEEIYVGVAIIPGEPIKDPVVTLGEIVWGTSHLLPASAAASGDCVVQPAKAWLHLCSPGATLWTLTSFIWRCHLLHPVWNAFFILFFFFPFLGIWGAAFASHNNSACPWLTCWVGRLESLPGLPWAYVRVKSEASPAGACRRCSDMAWRTQCCLEAALRKTPESRAPTACDNQRSCQSHTKQLLTK